MAADAKAPLIDCWDATFAYTMIGLRPAADGYEVRLTTQDPSVFVPLFPGLSLDWGQTDLDLGLAEDACVVDPERRIFSCFAAEAVASLTRAAFAGNSATSVELRVEDFAMEFAQAWRPGTVDRPGQPVLRRILLVRWRADGGSRTLRIDFDYEDYCFHNGRGRGAFDQ